MHRDIMGAPYLPCSYAAIRLLPTIYTRDRLSMLRGARTGLRVPVFGGFMRLWVAPCDGSVEAANR